MIIPFTLGMGAAAMCMLVKPDLPDREMVRRYATGASRFLDIDGVRVHYRDEGPRDGQALLLLHGSNVSLHAFEPWAKRLTDTYRVVSLDLPGHGLTGQMPDDDYNCERVVKWLHRFAEALGLEKLVVCGNSWGGLLAWLYAIRYAEAVSGLVLIDSVGFPFEDPFMWRLAQVQPFESILRYVTPRFLVRSELLSAVYDPSMVSEEQITLYYELLRRQGNRRAQILQNKQPFAFRATASALAQMKSIRVPTLIMWGANDPWLPPSVAYDFEREIPHARVIVYPETGHIPMEEHPDQTAADLRFFLAEAVLGQNDDSGDRPSTSGKAHFDRAG